VSCGLGCLVILRTFSVALHRVSVSRTLRVLAGMRVSCSLAGGLLGQCVRLGIAGMCAHGFSLLHHGSAFSGFP
jgi:hypothetical protein